MASNFQKEEEIQEEDSIVIGKSAQDGVNMAIANAAGGEGFGYGQYLQVNNILHKITKKITRLYLMNTFETLAESFYYVKYGASIITSKVRQIISILKRSKLVFPEK